MAEKQNPQQPQDAPPARTKAPEPKMVTCRVVTNYGVHRPGDLVTVTEREYLRLRTREQDENGQPVGDYLFPVLISDADAAIVAKREAQKRELEQKRQQVQSAEGMGWGAYEAEANEQLRRFHARQAKQAQDEIAALAETE